MSDHAATTRTACRHTRDQVPSTEEPVRCPHTHELFGAGEGDQQIPVPRGLPRPLFAGWPVPYNVPMHVLSDGQVPMFRNHDDIRQGEAYEKDLCMVCGESLRQAKRVVVVVDAETGSVVDEVAMHERCARLSLAWCPWLRDPAQKILVRVLPRRLWRRLRADSHSGMERVDFRPHGKPFPAERAAAPAATQGCRFHAEASEPQGPACARAAGQPPEG